MSRKNKGNNSMFIIEEIKKIHSSDIKDIIIIKEYIITVGRDKHIKIYNRSTEEISDKQPGDFYLNSIVAREVKDGIELFVGCQNGLIAKYSNVLSEVAPEFMAGHSQNVCSLDIKDNILASSSWDNTTRIWEDYKELFCLVHPATVWDCRIIDPENYATSCADGRIRIFKNNSIIQEFIYQVGCVRSLTVIENFYIYSISNDGKLMASNRNGEFLHHNDFNELTFSLDYNEGYIAISGENGFMVVTNSSLMTLYTVKIPVQSCWKVRIISGRIYVCGSDGKIYIFADPNIADPSKSSIAASEFESQMKEYFKINSKIKDFENKNYKVVDGMAYQKVDNIWVHLGEVVESKKEYDYTFEVNLDNRLMKLQCNKTDNAYEVADNFIHTNKLDSGHRSEIVSFIHKNTEIKENYFVYKNINVAGVMKYISKISRDGMVSKELIKQLDTPDLEQELELEDELKNLLQYANPGEYLPILDCYRYFISVGFQLEVAFLFTLEINTKKEAVVYTRLVTNLYENPPFNLECLYFKIRSFYDKHLIDEETLNNYENNRKLWKGSNKG